MSVALDGTPVVAAPTSGTTTDLTITIAANSNRALSLTFNGNGNSVVPVITGVVFDPTGVNAAFTNGGGTWVHTNGTRTSGAWVYPAPVAGAGKVIRVTFSGALTLQGVHLVLRSLYNVDQTTPGNNYASCTTNATSLNVTSPNGDYALISTVGALSNLASFTGGTIDSSQSPNESGDDGHGTDADGTVNFAWAAGSGVRSGSGINIQQAAASDTLMAQGCA